MGPKRGRRHGRKETARDKRRQKRDLANLYPESAVDLRKLFKLPGKIDGNIFHEPTPEF